MTNARQFALPLLGIVAVAAWWLWRPSAPDVATPPAVAPAKAPTATPRSGAGERAGDGPEAAAKEAAPRTGAPPPSTVRDARRSESIRTALRDRLRDESRAHDRANAAADDGDTPTGTLDKDYIQARIREDLVPIAKECYESALEDDPKLAGKIVMTFGIAGDEEVGGVVDEAAVDPTSTLTHPALGECMRESMMSLSFPAPEGGGRVAVTYPFEFSPDAPASK